MSETDEERQYAEGSTTAPELVAEVMQQLTSSAHVSSVFEQPRKIGDRTVIPAAEVMVGLGFGVGMGPGQGDVPGGGGGGGGGTRARPVAAIVVEPDRVYVEPILDLTQISLAGISLCIFGMFWLGRLLARGRGPQATEDPLRIGLSRLLRRD